MSDKEQQSIGGAANFWLYFPQLNEYDLTHPPTPESPTVFPRMELETTKARVTIAPTKTALVITDLQNYFLSPLLGRPRDAVGMKAVDKLVNLAIPACRLQRKAEIPIVWLNWGLTEDDIEGMPPSIAKGFAPNDNFDSPHRMGGLGSEVGPVKLEDGSIIDGGRVIMRGSWVAESYTPLKRLRQPSDIYIHKNRLSGFWGGTSVEEALTSQGIRTLLFAGANVDQCVGSSLQDALMKGWDCLLLSDGCATTSPDYCRQCIEYNAGDGWGFMLSCEQLARAAENIRFLPDKSV
ncbi:uncharacterized protein KY384_007420 [Bacidia gigantensis]|uniref:uncharacterized protein n=1 Tax=Bacidia gigantensis TaxID=2732470 RepID=UPI001D03A670|nr:uncharacterized protein KY384_007420 [Bacidia gigantensis]KAG8528502.1 hypothetical protein KY384_007420 [Bacidia gigantensis]